jgi:cyclopropane fatty-acyl-phospholipid synthase-like methyltransferase
VGAPHAAHGAPGAHVLELGAGYCDWINNVRAARRVAVDVWPELPSHTAPGVEPIVLDISTGLRPLGHASFDVVLASNLLEHFSPDAAAEIVRDVANVLRPAGRFMIIQPNFRYAWRRYFDDYTHRSIFTDVSLPALLRAQGFTILEVKPRFVPYSMQRARIPVASWLVKAYLRSPFKPAAGQMLVIAQKEARAHVR